MVKIQAQQQQPFRMPNIKNLFPASESIHKYQIKIIKLHLSIKATQIKGNKSFLVVG